MTKSVMEPATEVVEDAETTGDDNRQARSRRRGLSGGTIGIGQLVVGLVIAGLVVAVVLLGFVVSSRSATISDMEAQAADSARAEQIALDYAYAAADMNFNDLAGWKKQLTTGTSPELSEQLTQAATSMEQVIAPLQWVSTAEPIDSMVTSESGGVYVVNAFVSVLTKNSQAPDGVQSTATYTITIDGNNNWLITDVGGVDNALGQK